MNNQVESAQGSLALEQAERPIQAGDLRDRHDGVIALLETTRGVPGHHAPYPEAETCDPRAA